MRLALILPPVQRNRYSALKGCPSPGCNGQRFQHWQNVAKPLRDTMLSEVVSHRMRCLRCGRTFRLDPEGVSHDQTSARLKGVAVMFYVLGMSYGAPSTALGALGWPLSKVAVYNAVQAAGAQVVGLRREAVARGRGRIAALGADLTSVRCGGQCLTVGISVDAVRGTVLSLDLLPNGETATLSSWVQELSSVLGAELVVSDDADGFKTTADEAGLLQHGGFADVLRNTAAWVDGITAALETDADGSLAAIGGRPSHAVTDAQTLPRLITERQPSPEASTTLEALHRRYLTAPKPCAGDTTSLAYRLASSAWIGGTRGTA